MTGEFQSGRSHRLVRLLKKFRNKRYRDSYVSAMNTRFLAQQMRALRGDMSQEEFGKLLGKPQSVISRLEDPSYGKFTQQTLHEVAAKMDRAVITRIVDYGTFVRLSESMSEQAICPPTFDEDNFPDDELNESFEGSAEPPISIEKISTWGEVVRVEAGTEVLNG